MPLHTQLANLGNLGAEARNRTRNRKNSEQFIHFTSPRGRAHVRKSWVPAGSKSLQLNSWGHISLSKITLSASCSEHLVPQFSHCILQDPHQPSITPHTFYRATGKINLLFSHHQRRRPRVTPTLSWFLPSTYLLTIQGTQNSMTEHVSVCMCVWPSEHRMQNRCGAENCGTRCTYWEAISQNGRVCLDLWGKKQLHQ